MIAVPVGSEIKLYDRLSWKCMFSLDDNHHKEVSSRVHLDLHHPIISRRFENVYNLVYTMVHACTSFLSQCYACWYYNCTFQPVNVVSWSPCGAYLASGGADGAVCLWDVNSRLAYSKMKNESSIGITSMEWDPRGHGAQDGKKVD